MKIKLSIILAMLLIAVLSLTCVSAVENITNDTALSDSDIELLSGDEELVKDINVTFPQHMWEKNLSDINVDLPENASGDFCVKINDNVIYNQTITSKSFRVPIKIPVTYPELVISIWPPIDCKTYKVSAYYNDIDLNITTPLKIMKFSPDYNTLFFPQEILKNDKYTNIIAFPRSANGIVEFYIDKKLFNKTNARPTFHWSDNPFSKLPLGEHTFTIVYYGDDYYSAYNKTFNFNVTDVKIIIPDVINIGHDDCISVETMKNVNGNVKVYIDNKVIYDSKLTDNEFILSLENYVKYTDREIKVVFTSKEFSRTKTKAINMTYNLDVWMTNFRYGDENILEIDLPDTLNNKLLKVMIDGKQYPFKRSTTVVNNMVEVDISNLKGGTYSLLLSYSGDSKYYPLNKTYNITIDYNINVPYSTVYKTPSKIYLNLPKDANGSLAVYINDELYKSNKLTDGYAEVIVNFQNIGIHKVWAEYTGDDYNVTSVSARLNVEPKIDYNYQITEGENEYITVEVPKTSKGYVIFDVNEKEYKVNVVNGIAKFSLKKLKPDEYDIIINYYSEDGFKDTLNWAYIEVKKAKIKLVSNKANFKGVNFKIKLQTKQGKALKGKIVTVKFNGKKYKIKTNKKGILTFKKAMKLKNKKYPIKISYLSAKLTKKITIKPIILTKTESKKKLIIKAAINKKIKNKNILIKVNNKKYNVKTNKKGMAKLIIKKPKNKVKIKATYQKSTVKI